jgi:HAD superfamily hydrolase (TIGR01509 family)
LKSTATLQAVIFDCDGILVDTEPLHYKAFQEVLSPLGLGFDYDEYNNRYIGFDDRDAFLEAFRSAGRELDSPALAALILAKARALQEIVAKGIDSFPGVSELVRELAGNQIPLAVASGALRHEVEAFLESLSLSDAFQTIVAADDVVRSKPDPESYLLALERLSQELGNQPLNARCCIAIEDTPAGISAAKDAGLFVIGVTNSFPRERLIGADLVLESLAEINVQGMNQLILKRT